MLRHKKSLNGLPAWLIEFHLKTFNRWLSPNVKIPLNLVGTERAAEYLPAAWTRESSERLNRLFVITVQALEAAIDGPATDELNELLSAYPATPALLFEDDEQRPALASIPNSSSYPNGETAAVYAMLQLAQIGNLSSFKVCGECKQVFKPTKANQRNCSAFCSRAAYSKLPQERERRKRAAREYYDRNGRKKPLSAKKGL